MSCGAFSLSQKDIETCAKTIYLHKQDKERKREWKREKESQLRDMGDTNGRNRKKGSAQRERRNRECNRMRSERNRTTRAA